MPCTSTRWSSAASHLEVLQQGQEVDGLGSRQRTGGAGGGSGGRSALGAGARSAHPKHCGTVDGLHEDAQGSSGSRRRVVGLRAGQRQHAEAIRLLMKLTQMLRMLLG